jgi:hypothetical protein
MQKIIKRRHAPSSIFENDNQYYYVNNNKVIEKRLKDEISVKTTHGGRPGNKEKEEDFLDWCQSRSIPRQDPKRNS